MATLLHVAALARRLGVPATWLRREADDGRLPCVRAGTRYLFDLEVVERLLAARAAAETVGTDQPGEAADAQPR